MRNSLVESERLILRPWCEKDLQPFANLNADPRVMEFFPSVKTFEESQAEFNRFKKGIDDLGWGLWAASLKSNDQFIGFIGLYQVPFSASFVPAVEIGWRLAYDYWGMGYATEGAKVAMKYGFETLGLDEIVSFTPVPNTRSQNVMKKIGMKHIPDDDFDHPRLDEGHLLRRHVLYRMKKSDPLAIVSETCPSSFKPKVEVAACYLENDGKLLVMQRSMTQSEPNTWGVPAGKIELNETSLDGAIRELCEETSIKANRSQFTELGKLYIQRPQVDFVYHMFQVNLSEKPVIQLSDEHTRYMWVDKSELVQLPLISGAYEAFSYYSRKKKSL